MVRVIHVAEDGVETSTIELEDFTVEILYSGIARMLEEAESAPHADVPPAGDLSRATRQRREKILTRIYG